MFDDTASYNNHLWDDTWMITPKKEENDS